ncbi:PQQ-binding-like beta-propeller repeat protein [Ruminiclostridium cellobioparum]|uniref:PQQ enzyme repeat-containing protein n=1 Tax=Ruminiclostridium cellobioparum subsp. termitidis CT1112 TaxID=1195236 RepID=S0FJ20_RUMCE|nr:PQQ-binding-like beta-propeller repeat protein [Ruminiclostridium cellobioparum]EMS71702.1 PQQ enzyme repeat-containing protein [Ruminiclostridium cellobioparum subsp. termitidis CT1112]
MSSQGRKKNSLLPAITVFFTILLVALTALYLMFSGNLPWLNTATGTNSANSSKAHVSAVNTTKPADGSQAGASQGQAEETVKEPAESTNPNDLLISWKNPASLISKKTLGDGSAQKSYKDGGKITFWTLVNNKTVKDYTPPYNIAFGSPENYSELEGVTAFRGNNYRTAPSWGKAGVKEKKLEIVWTHDIGAVSGVGSYWPGAGWTGQPLLVHWSDEVRQIMNINAEFKSRDLVEVIYPVFDGNVYFLDMETGKPSRPKMNIGFTVKGTGMVDPRGYPLFYTGQGLNENDGKTGAFKYRIFDLINQKLIYSFPGNDPVAFRSWGANDSSALLNRYTDTLINCGENGLVYKAKLNTKFDSKAGTISIDPSFTKYRYKSSYSSEQGIENSPAFYRNLMYFADNGGTIQCLDINKMEPVWIYKGGDDTDSTITLEETDEGVFLYTANEIDKRGREGSRANSNIRKINALTGELVWQKDYSCAYQSYINGGVLATPVVGKNDISDIVIFNIALTGSTSDGTLVALDKKTGAEIWKRHLEAYSWSSPVDFMSEEGKTYMLLCDFKGDMHLIDPKTGEDLDKISVGGNVEASPAVYNNMAVVGTYAKKIYGVRIK